jgi:hypothetical protein
LLKRRDMVEGADWLMSVVGAWSRKRHVKKCMPMDGGISWQLRLAKTVTQLQFPMPPPCVCAMHITSMTMGTWDLF